MLKNQVIGQSSDHKEAVDNIKTSKQRATILGGRIFTF